MILSRMKCRFVLLFAHLACSAFSAPAGNSNHHQTGTLSKIINAPFSMVKNFNEKRTKAVHEAIKGKQAAQKQIDHHKSNFLEAIQYAPVGHSEHERVLKLAEQKRKAEVNAEVHNLAGLNLKGHPHISQPMKGRADQLRSIPKRIQGQMKEAKEKGVFKDNAWDHVDAYHGRSGEHKKVIEKHEETIRKNSGFLPW